MTLVNQPSKKPTRKVTSGALGGAVVAVAMGGVNAWSPDIYERLMHPGFEAGLATLVGFALAYMVRDSV